MDLKNKTLRYAVGTAVVFLSAEAVMPLHEEPFECEAVRPAFCPAAEVVIEPRNEHLPHSEHDPMVPTAYQWIASGQVNSTTATRAYKGFTFEDRDI